MTLFQHKSRHVSREKEPAGGSSPQGPLHLSDLERSKETNRPACVLPKAGVEPAREVFPSDFKSDAFANYATSAYLSAAGGS